MKFTDIFNKIGKQLGSHTNKEAYVVTEDGTYHINSIKFDKYGDFHFEGNRVSLRRLNKTEVKQFAKDLKLPLTDAKDIVNLLYQLKKQKNELLTGDMITYEDYYYEFENQWFRSGSIEEMYREYSISCSSGYEKFFQLTMDEYEDAVVGNTVFWLPNAKKYIAHI